MAKARPEGADLSKIGAAFESIRGCLGYTMKKMANLMNYSEAKSYEYWITGVRQVPHNSTARLVRAGLNSGFLYDMREPMLNVEPDVFRQNAAQELNEAIEEMMRRVG